MPGSTALGTSFSANFPYPQHPVPRPPERLQPAPEGRQPRDLPDVSRPDVTPRPTTSTAAPRRHPASRDEAPSPGGRYAAAAGTGTMRYARSTNDRMNPNPRPPHRRAGPLFGALLLVVTAALAFTPIVPSVGAIDPTPAPSDSPAPSIDPTPTSTPDPTPARLRIRRLRRRPILRQSPAPDPTATPTPDLSPSPDPSPSPTPSISTLPAPIARAERRPRLAQPVRRCARRSGAAA